MTKTLVKGYWYTVTTTTTCTVTDADGRTLGTAEEGKQFSFKATTENITFSDDAAVVQSENFDFAPAKLKLLGLLGGGSTNALPSGYIAAEFLESDGATAVIDSQIVPDFETGVYVKMHVLKTGGTFYYLGTQNTSGAPAIWISTRDYSFSIRYNKSDFNIAALKTTSFAAKINWLNSKVAETSLGQNPLAQDGASLWRYHVTFFRATFTSNSRYDNGSQARFYYIKMSQGTEIVRDMRPCISPDGEPCMWDNETKQPFKNAATGSFVVGLTLPQARKLSKLPATGGTLTISLPSNWQEDAGVVDALATAEANGWVLTYQTYEADTSTASTFALRRIFVRKTQNENGQYVAADGTRWYVEWCAGMIGAEPTEHGYEPFRSVDAAVAYWELEPWVDPNAEEFLTTTTE